MRRLVIVITMARPASYEASLLRSVAILYLRAITRLHFEKTVLETENRRPSFPTGVTEPR